MCEIDITYYPFDDQKCKLTFGAWTYHTGKMNMSNLAEKVNNDSYNVSYFNYCIYYIYIYMHQSYYYATSLNVTIMYIYNIALCILTVGFHLVILAQGLSISI